MSDAADLIGHWVGRYRVLGLIGEGGMAQVYLAEHGEPSLARQVAIKVLLPQFCSSQQMVARFVNEAKALGRISHPGVVAIYDVETLPDGRIALIMELLRGNTLHAWRHSRPSVSLEEALPIMLQLTDTMAAAHDQGIVHRDIKPENIFLIHNVTGVQTKVLDFGIAKLAEGAGMVVTATHARFGTAAYMPPEQFRSSKDVDHRSDIYALGCVMFELFAGRPPFVSTNMALQMQMHLREPPPTLASLLGGIPPDLDSILQCMLAKSREGRFASMRAVQNALRSLA